MKCSFCGAELKEGAPFCGNCGHKIITERIQNCPVCGTPLNENENFCRKCGCKITDFNRDSIDSGKKTCPSCGSVVKSNTAFCSTCGFPLGNKDDFPNKKRSSKRIWFVVASIILIIALFDVAICFFYLNIHEKSSESITEASVNHVNNNPELETEAETTTITVEIKEEKTPSRTNNENTLDDNTDNNIEEENKNSDHNTAEFDYNNYDGFSPFYGIWCFASKDRYNAQKVVDILVQNGYSSASVYTTTDWSNLNTEKWYVVSAGAYVTKGEADAALSGVQSIYPNAYVKYSGDWQG